MKKEILAVGIMLVLLAVGFSGCLNESTVGTLAQQMEDAYNSVSDYRATINYTTYNEYSKEYTKTIKKPDKLRYEYLTPEYRNGDLNIVNGTTQWGYDKSKNIAYQDTYNVNIGEGSLATPDFLNLLLFLMDNFDVNQLDDELVGEFDTYVLEMTPKFQTTFSKFKYWLDKETFFPIKWEIYGTNGEVRSIELVTSFEINIGLEDSEFELPGDVEILTPGAWLNPETIEECEEIVGFTVLFPTYLPEGYMLDNYDWRMQGVDFEKMVTIDFYHNDSKYQGGVGDEGEEDPMIITLHEAYEDFLEEHYQPKTNAITVDINGMEGEYYIDIDEGQYGEVVYTRSCLSWNLNDYWFMLAAGGDAFLDSDEMVKIAESISI